ncbi:MAG: class I poly(R)-hydroxyalkanoic acid synthase [Vicinamibacterales bacterium]
MQWAAQSPEFARLYAAYARDASLLWQRTLEREEGKLAEPLVTPEQGDRRFAATEWSSNSYFDFLKQSYLLGARFLKQAANAAELEPHTKGQVAFIARQTLDACAPSNFVATNPEVLAAAFSSNGETLKRGIEQLIGDLGRGRVSNVDESAFAVGKNLAIQPGSVVFENDLFQLIQYMPMTAKVHARPLLLVPPCINKFYVLDLQPENSFVRYAVSEGHTVFILSWRNPDESLAKIGWDDYVERGAILAIDLVRRISGEERINVLGFCVGGTLLSTALAVLAERKKHWVESLTLLATLLDFSDTGEIGCFVTEESVAKREQELAGGGLLSGKELNLVFSALRDGDLIWPYVVNSYLKGVRPAAFDILYWNADSTNLPGPMFTWYIRNLYLENKLREPGGTAVGDTPVDLSKIGVSAFLVATREDHIVPWQSAYRSVALLGAATEFVLGASGHIAGIINPAAKGKRSHWVGAAATPTRSLGKGKRGAPMKAPSADEWLVDATEVPGSWWPHWISWLNDRAGVQKTAPKQLGDAKHKPIEPAPGRYVRARI